MTSTDPTGAATPETLPVSRERTIAPAARKARKSSRWSGCLPWLLLVLLIGGALAVWKFPAFKRQAEVGAAYAARVGCSCRYVEGRDLKSCVTDFEPGMEIISVSDDPAARSVTGSVPLLATRTARFAGASGCLLDPAD